MILRPWPARLLALVVLVLTLGLVRLDRPRIRRVPTMRLLRRWLTTVIARFHGRRDGRLGMPGTAEVNSPPELWKLKQHGDAWVRDIAATWYANESRLASERDAISKAIEAVNTHASQRTCELGDLTRQHDVRKKRLAQMKDRDEGRAVDDRWRISSWFYWPAIVLVFAGEFPLNAVAFNLFGDNRWATYAMTAGLAAVLVFCAHSLGVLSRLKKMSDRDLAITIVVALIPVATIVAIGVVREKYLQALGGLGEGLAILGSVTGVIIFVTMNLVIYVGAAVLSYLHHDPDGELIDRLAREVRGARRAVRRKQRSIDRLENTRRWLESKIELWEGGRDQARRTAVLQGKRHKDIYEAAMEAYWGSNRVATRKAWRTQVRRERRRGNPLPAEPLWPPVCFETPPEIALADEFAEEFRPEVLLERAQREATARTVAVAKRRRLKSPTGTTAANGKDAAGAAARLGT